MNILRWLVWLYAFCVHQRVNEFFLKSVVFFFSQKAFGKLQVLCRALLISKHFPEIIVFIQSCYHLFFPRRTWTPSSSNCRIVHQECDTYMFRTRNWQRLDRTFTWLLASSTVYCVMCSNTSWATCLEIWLLYYTWGACLTGVFALLQTQSRYDVSICLAIAAFCIIWIVMVLQKALIRIIEFHQSKLSFVENCF